MDAVLAGIEHLEGTVTSHSEGIYVTVQSDAPPPPPPRQLCNLLAQPSKDRKQALRRCKPEWARSLIGAGATSTIFCATQVSREPRRYALDVQVSVV